MTRRLIVDGMNVIGSRPTGWWRDRDGAARALHERLRALAVATGEEITLVLDGRPPSGLDEDGHGGVRVLYGRGRNGADDRIVEVAAAHPDPASLVVVTADRDLSRRLEALGVATSGPRQLLGRLDRLEEPG